MTSKTFKTGTVIDADWLNDVNDTVYNKLDRISVFSFGAKGNGVADDTAAIQQAALQALAQGKQLYFPRVTYRINGSILIRGDRLSIDFNGASFVLGSSSAGFALAGFAMDVNGGGASVSQLNASDTPTFLKIFNDTTTPLSTMAKVRNISGSSVYRGVYVYMGVNGSGQACYRASVQDCRFENMYLPKTWVGSFGIGFDGPNAGDAGGNDSRVINCIVKGYERNYVINNSTATQLIGCSGDGAASAISYEGTSAGLQVIGGYYEYNDVFLSVVGVAKYDAYLWNPSYGNNTTFMTGAGITYLCGAMPVGAPYADIANGAFKTVNTAGTAELFATNGIKAYSSNSKVLRLTLDGSGDWTFESGRLLLKTGMSLLTDTVQGYSGGAVPLDLNAANKISLTTAGVKRGEFNTTQGLMLKPLTSSSPAANGEMVFELTSNTSLKIKVQGSDGVIRSTTLTLA